MNQNTLFLALTRPSMIMGVTMEVFFGNLIIALCLFIGLKNILFALIWLPLHFTALLVCRFDSQFFSIWLCKARLGQPANFAIWGCKSYEPY